MADSSTLEMEVLACVLRQMKWVRVTGRDEVEVALPSENGRQSFLYLNPDGTWRTSGMGA